MAVSLPMDSNPDTMSKYLHKLGVSDKWKVVDVMGLDQDALSWVPRPVMAVILLFPITDAYEKHRAEEESELLKQGHKPSQDVFHLKQVLSNVCGTIALVHGVANNTKDIEIKDGLLKKYIEDAKQLDSSQKGALLENSLAILDAYKEIIRTDASANIDDDEPVSNHFVTFVHKDGNLYELDGRKQFPIIHGETTPDTLLEDSVKICRKFMERDPDNIGFTIVALVPAQ